MKPRPPLSDPPPSDRDAAERREHPRSKTLREGMIRFNNGWSVLPCTIYDVSKSGARLHLKDISFHCPDEFELLSEATEKIRLCTVMWRHGHEVGVRWLDDIGKL